MKRIDANTVQLTRTEQDAFTIHHEALDHGYGMLEAVEVVRRAHPRLSEDFYSWLGGS
jgi:hypothetical protein